MRRAKVAERTYDSGTARTLYERLLAEYPESSYRDKAQRALANLPPPVAAGEDDGESS